MKEAKDKADKSPKQILTDGWKGYIDGIEQAYGADCKHVLTTPFGNKDDSSSVLERWHGTLKDRTKILRGLK